MTVRATSVREHLDAADFGTLVDTLDPSVFECHEAGLYPRPFLEDPFAVLQAVRAELGPVAERNAALEVALARPELAGMARDGLPTLLNPHAFEADPFFVVLDHDAVCDVWRRPEISTNWAGPAVEAFSKNTVLFMDGDAHRRYRNLIGQALRRSAVDRWAAELAGPIGEYLVDRVAQRGRGDLVRDLAAPLPFAVMATMLGLPTSELSRFVRLAIDLTHASVDLQRGMEAALELSPFFYQQMLTRREDPGDDLVSLLVQAEFDGERLPDEAVVANLLFLLPAGIETTFRSISNMFLLLLTHPEQFQAVVADPSLVPAAVEEALRLEGPAGATTRVAEADFDLGSVHIPRGSGLSTVQAFANRDPKVWENPDTFDIHRPLHPQLSFVGGPHMCLGMHLARLEMQAALRLVVERIPSVRLAANPADLPILGFVLRSAPSCPVTLS